VLRPVVWRFDRDAEWRQARWFFALAGWTAVGTLANPYGWRLHEHVLRYLADRELLARVAEFQSFNFHVAGAGQILATVLIAGLGAVVALGRRNPARALLLAMLIAGALRSARVLPLVALAGLPLANAALTEALGYWSGLQPRLRRALDAFLAYSARVRALDSRFHGAALVPVVAVLALVLLRAPAIAARIGFPPDQFPVAASTVIAGLPADARILAPDKYGGYLIYRFEGRRKVFFDGRSDFYGLEFMKRYIRLIEVRPGWKELVEQSGFTHALLPNDYSLVAALEQAGWKRLYADTTTTLLEADKQD
jgi:hypothetical protein